ncbi:MAG: aminoacyl-histidine dipeptidase [Bacteroidales bacterium]|jgi:dipeptidase D|nr:aminoacyl-histidine dipeptidase [Bacteroidales bacterium]
MNEFLKTLQPEKIWHYFGEVLNIPRPSKKEEKIREYLLAFGAARGLETDTDSVGNILIRKPATPGFESHNGVVLQAHIDMVAEKTGTSTHNFETDPIEAREENGWIKAKDTTLGADNGIGVAACLAVLDSNDLQHPAIEALFTVDEETGLTGAFGLKTGWLKGKTLLNLDSEDDGQFFIGCAGGIGTYADYAFNTEPLPNAHKVYAVQLHGLQGGHSGDDINKGRGNANQLLARFLYSFSDKLSLRLASFNGGNLHNAIPREASAVIAVPDTKILDLEKSVIAYEKVLQNELKYADEKVKFSLAPASTEKVLAKNNQLCIIFALCACPHGVLRMSDTMENFVETSTNLASVKTEKGHIKIVTSQRSSIETAKYFAAHRVASTFKLAGAEVNHNDGYPGWNPNPDSKIAHLAADTFRKSFNQEPKVLAIHAGLECGLIGEKYPEMDMVSFGPTMRGVHSPDERLEIKAVERFWELLVEILKQL